MWKLPTHWSLAHLLAGKGAPPYLAFSFTCVADMLHRRKLRSASTDRLDVPTSVCQELKIVLFLLLVQRYGTACQAMWHQLRRWRCLRTGSRRTCSAAATKLLTKWHFFLVILSLQNSGHCNSVNCLGHSKLSVDDDDDDDDDEVRTCCRRAVAESTAFSYSSPATWKKHADQNK